MLQAYGGSIECRAEADGVTIRGRFPYSVQTELAPGRFEVMAPGALHARADTYLLAGHDFDRPLASREAGSLTLTDTAEALQFEARIAPEVAATSHGRDMLALIHSGLAVGLSPGFRVLADGEEVQRDGAHLVRTIRAAELYELSIVTRPAYSTAQVEARSWQAEPIRFVTLAGPARPFWWYR